MNSVREIGVTDNQELRMELWHVAGYFIAGGLWVMALHENERSWKIINFVLCFSIVVVLALV